MQHSAAIHPGVYLNPLSLSGMKQIISIKRRTAASVQNTDCVKRKGWAAVQ